MGTRFSVSRTRVWQYSNVITIIDYLLCTYRKIENAELLVDVCVACMEVSTIIEAFIPFTTILLLAVLPDHPRDKVLVKFRICHFLR